MKLLRIVLSDLHLGTGNRRGRQNPFEDFHHDDRFVELLQFYDEQAGPQTTVEIILNGDIFDLLKVKVRGRWPTAVTNEVAAAKLRKCLEGHPKFVRALRDFLSKANRRLTYLPGNHDLDMWFPGPQELLRRYIAPELPEDRLRFITASDTYYLPEGIQIRHGHQLERIHRVDYENMTRIDAKGREVLTLPWGSLWILEVMNPAKEERNYVDRIQPLRRFILGALLLDSGFAIRFIWRSVRYFLRHKVFTLRAWRERLAAFPKLIREEIVALGGYDQAAAQALRAMRGVHTLIVGHSHGPRFKSIPGEKLLVNTGTWMRMVNLDLQHLGQDSGLTFALIEYSDDGTPHTSLNRWYGQRPEVESVPYAD